MVIKFRVLTFVVMEKSIVRAISPTMEQFKELRQLKLLSIPHNAQLKLLYEDILEENNLYPDRYRPMINWGYRDDDFIKNRITITVKAILK